jgi:hypothetical protein
MTGPRMQVDLGPMSMAVGEARHESGWTGLHGADADAALRLKDLLARGTPQHSGPQQMAAHAGSAALPAIEPDRAARFHAHSESDQLGPELERLWLSVSGAPAAAREINVQISPHILRDTWLRMADVGGRLHIEFTVGDAQTQAWLNARLAPLAEDVGSRLSRALSIAVRGRYPEARQPVCLNWPEGQPG